MPKYEEVIEQLLTKPEMPASEQVIYDLYFKEK